MMGQFPGADESHRHLNKAEAHQIRAEWDRKINHPHRYLEIRGDLVGMRHLPNKARTECADNASKKRAAGKS